MRTIPRRPPAGRLADRDRGRGRRRRGRVGRPGRVGRIRMRGPGVTRSFAGETAAGDETIRDGWYYPGDTGHFAENGILHLTGRAADLIKRGGLMIHAQEVEYVLSLHESVVEAAVVGHPDRRQRRGRRRLHRRRVARSTRPRSSALPPEPRRLQGPAEAWCRSTPCRATPTARSSRPTCASLSKPDPERP